MCKKKKVKKERGKRESGDMVSCKIVLEKENHIFLHCDCCMTEVLRAGGRAGLRGLGFKMLEQMFGFYCTAAVVGQDGRIGPTDGRTDSLSKQNTAGLTSFKGYKSECLFKRKSLHGLKPLLSIVL